MNPFSVDPKMSAINTDAQLQLKPEYITDSSYIFEISTLNNVLMTKHRLASLESGLWLRGYKNKRGMSKKLEIRCYILITYCNRLWATLSLVFFFFYKKTHSFTRVFF